MFYESSIAILTFIKLSQFLFEKFSILIEAGYGTSWGAKWAICVDSLETCSTLQINYHFGKSIYFTQWASIYVRSKDAQKLSLKWEILMVSLV